MKKISLKMSNDFKIVPLCKNNIYALENNSAMIEIDCEVRSDLSYKLHIQSKNDKTVMLMDKGEHVITAMLKEPYISSNGVYYIQLEGVKSDYRIISNSIRFEVGSFINANHIPTPEEQGIIDQLVIRVGEVEEGLRIVELAAEEADELARNAVPLVLYDEDMTQIDARINESTETINWFVTEFSATINDLFENIVRIENDVEGLQDSKQDTLVSGENIATINGHNLLDGGNIEIQGGGGSGMEYYKVTYDGTHILHNGVALTFNDVVAKYYDDNYFLYAEAYGLTMIPTLPPYEGDDILEFICTWIENGAVTISRLIINALNQVKFEDVEVAKKSDIPTVPTKTSELTNDSGFITARDVPAPYDDTEIRGEVSAVSEEVTQVKADLSLLPTDVQIDGTSILENKIASIPYATQTKGGVFKTNSVQGVILNADGRLTVYPADNSNIDARSTYKPIASTNIDYAVKSAMCDGKGAEWTDAEKANARNRLGLDGSWERLVALTTEEDTQEIMVEADILKYSDLFIHIWTQNSNGSASIYRAGLGTSDGRLHYITYDSMPVNNEGHFYIRLEKGVEVDENVNRIFRILGYYSYNGAPIGTTAFDTPLISTNKAPAYTIYSDRLSTEALNMLDKILFKTMTSGASVKAGTFIEVYGKN